jgi:hypothetical protein
MTMAFGIVLKAISQILLQNILKLVKIKNITLKAYSLLIGGIIPRTEIGGSGLIATPITINLVMSGMR